MQLRNYSLIKELGQGGMATVHLAEDPKFHTEVAVKVLNKEFVHNENIRKRFLAEARNMFRMSHPNIVKVTDLVDEEDTVAFVMEYIEGETLKDYLERKGKLSDEEIKTIFSQMLEAVGYVHEHNLVHRDIKPSNFMIDKKGMVKLMDFGIAKNTDATSAEYTQTGTGMQMGTPMYMSPEQITETKSVTAQSDIYSLGVVLWQMVTGEKPYDVKTLSSFQLQLKIVNEPLLKVNAKWDQTIQKATSKIQSERLQTCLEFQNALNKGKKTNLDSKDKLSSNTVEDKTILESKPLQQQPAIRKEQPKLTKMPPKAIEVQETKRSKLWYTLFLIIPILLRVIYIGINNDSDKSVDYDEDFPYTTDEVMPVDTNKTVNFFNQSSTNIYLAIAYNTIGGYEVHGWYKIDVNGSIDFPLSTDYVNEVFWYANSENGGVTWDGNNQFCIDRNNIFDYTAIGDHPCDTVVGFRKLNETGLYTSYKIIDY